MKELDFLNRNQFGAFDYDINLQNYPDVKETKMILTPFLFNDGDHLSFYAYKKKDGILTFSDLGDLFFHKSSISIDDSWNNETGKYLINKVLIKYDFAQEKGIFYKKVNHLYSVDYQFYRYLQGLICLANLLEI